MTKIEISNRQKDQLAFQETIFHVANGYLGVRGNYEEGTIGATSIRGCYVNGFYDHVQLKYPETLYGFPSSAQRLINLPDFQTIVLSINGEQFSLDNGNVLSYNRQLDMEQGVTIRSISWESPNGLIVDINIKRMASLVFKPLFVIEYAVCCQNADVQILWESTLQGDVFNYSDPTDPRLAAESVRHIMPIKTTENDDGGLMICKTVTSDLMLGVAVAHLTTEQSSTTIHCTDSYIQTNIVTHAYAGTTVKLHKLCTVTDSLRYNDVEQSCMHTMHEIKQFSIAQLYTQQYEYLRQFWSNSRVEIFGNEEDQRAMDFNLYQLLQSAGTDGVGNIAAKGLSGEGYEGHFFWDTEIYMLPFFVITNPEMAQGLLNFRYRGLDAARKHAKIMGHSSGALYPWRTISGSECSSYFPSGSAQYHINGDIAHSFLLYFYMTGDKRYMAEKGAEVIFETARLWLDVGHYNKSGEFCIDAVTGPDEYTCIVNNNYYTNRSAQHNLLGAVELYHMLVNENLCDVIHKIAITEDDINEFEHAAKAMRLPYDEKMDINKQDDSFLDKKLWDISQIPKENFPLLLHYHPLYLYRYQVCKQADTILAHYLFDQGVKLSTIRNSLNYYEKVTTHDSSLSRCIFSIMHAKLGNVDKAYDYCSSTLATDLSNSQGNTKDGIHSANMGGAYLAITAGFAGMRCYKDELHFNFTLPKQWRGYSFKVQYHNCSLKIKVTNESAQIVLLEGATANIYINGRLYEFLYNTPATIKYK